MQRRSFIIFLFTSAFAAACASPATDVGQDILNAYQRHLSNAKVSGQGVVTRVLADDTSGTPHQRFIVRISSGQTVLIDHNILIAPRVADLKPGDTIEFLGEYVWNDRGGLVHWTHHDPAQKHTGGWLKRNGVLYE